MSTKKIGLLNIGQSVSGASLDPDFVALPSDQYEVIEVSPLDDYQESALLEHFAPLPDEMPLRSVLASGENFLISHSKLVPILQRGLAIAASQGANTVVVTCTTDFDLENSYNGLKIMLPGRVLTEAVSRLTWENGDRVAVLCPIVDQEEPLAARWKARLPKGVEVQGTTISPTAPIDCWSDLARRLKIAGVKVAILDCFGFSTIQEKQLVNEGLQVVGVKTEVIRCL